MYGCYSAPKDCEEFHPAGKDGRNAVQHLIFRDASPVGAGLSMNCA